MDEESRKNSERKAGSAIGLNLIDDRPLIPVNPTKEHPM